MSFTGSSQNNIRDLVMMLEEHNLQYSIRMNSVPLEDYTEEITADLPTYSHYIAYAANAILKPYQIYLIGRPSNGSKDWGGQPLRNTMAFRSMAVSFAKLLSPKNYDLRLFEYEPNSASVYIPAGKDLTVFLRGLTEQAILEEQRYYLKRYMVEIGDGMAIAVVLNSSDTRTQAMVQANTRIFRSRVSLPYGEITLDQIGNVSQKSRKFHEAHIAALSDKSTSILSAPILSCNSEILEHFRTRHPLAEVRTWCNVTMGLRKYCLSEVNSGHAALEDRYRLLQSQSDPKLSVHQREIMTAMKLLVLAASRDCYEYGIDFCKGLSLRRPVRSQGLDKVLRIYRLISYLFTDFQRMMGQGLIDIKSIHAIENSLEVREKSRYKYVSRRENKDLPEFDPELADKIIGNQIEKMFEGFDKYGQTIIELEKDERAGTSLSEVLGTSEMIFDIGISDQVNSAIDRLGLKPSGPHGFIDLGDEDIYEADDW